jgi:opacity protein-like surface antigen
MKKIILTIAIVLGVSQFAQAQTDLGAGVLLGGYDSIGIEAKANFGVTDQISISPSFDYFLVDSAYDWTMFMISADGHYNFEVGEGFVAYPLIGLNYLNISGDGYSWGTGIGLNIGGGATYGLSDSMKLYAEAKYMRTGFGLSAGLLFSL